MNFRETAYAIIAIVTIMLPLLAPLSTAFSTFIERDIYEPVQQIPAILEEDKADMMASPMMTRLLGSGPVTVQEDTADYVFQGQGIFGSQSVGYMNNTVVELSKIGTLSNFTYKYYKWEVPTPFAGMPWLGKETPAPQAAPVKEPVEGWFLSFKVSEDVADFEGVLVVTFSGFDPDSRAVVPYLIYNETTGKKLEITGFDVYTLAGNSKLNSRLVVKKYVIHITAISKGDEETEIKLYFDYIIVASINKATKRVVFNQYVAYKMVTKCCEVVPINVYYGRIAVLDANPSNCHSFYGWNNISLPKCSCTEEKLPVFLVLSWTNSTLDPDWRSDPENYTVYMAAYPYDEDNFKFAITSIMNDPQFSAIWRALHLTSNYAMLDMSDHDSDTIPDGDVALIRVEWAHSTVLHNNTDTVTPKVTVAYGIYDINGTSFNGGEGGPFDAGSVVLSNGVTVSPPGIATHPATSDLGFLETGDATAIQGAEAKLSKTLSAVDLNNDGSINHITEMGISIDWWPVEELAWQLYNIFQGPCFNKLASFDFHADFLAIHPAQVATDPAGATWLQGIFRAQLVTFDTDVAGTEVWVGAASSAVHLTINQFRRLPFLLLRIQGPVIMTTLKPMSLADMRTFFELPDGRYLLQMEPTDIASTPWRDVHYLVVAVAGPGANRVTRYFNDFAGIFFGAGITKESFDGQGSATGTVSLGGKIVIEPSGEIISTEPIQPGEQNTGYAVVAITKDHFNNTGFIVWGLTAADSYWAAMWVAQNIASLTEKPFCHDRALLLAIDYTTSIATDGEWGEITNSGLYPTVPLGAPNTPSITVVKEVSGQDVMPFP